MDDLMKCLFDFTLERRMGSVCQDPEHAEAVRSVEFQLERVQRDMAEEQKKELRELLEEISAQTAIENEHLFQASLGLARELRALLMA